MLNVADSAALAREWRFSRRAEHVGVQVGANRFVYVYEAIDNRTWASSNRSAAVVRALADCGTATNEAWTVGGEAATLVRTLDAQGRVSSLALSGGGYAQAFAYDADGRLAAVSNAEAVAAYAYAPDGRNAGCTLTLANGTTFTHALMRDPFRRDLVARIENRVNGTFASSLDYAYDALSRPVSRNADTFGYNARGEVVSSHGGAENTEGTYAYDHIGNAVLAASGGVTNAYTANALNQYASILRASPLIGHRFATRLRLGGYEPPCEPTYDADGNMTSDGTFSYAYDAASRLVSVSSNGVNLVMNFYDAQSRRVRKATPEATSTYFYDGWNLVEERVTHANGTTSTIRYYWGKDISDSLQGAGGIGGLLYLTVDGEVYVPLYDSNGNVTHYLDANGGIVAAYKYDAFGKTIAQSGPLAGFFRHRFSTKYLDAETGLYYYGYRFYCPSLMRWLNRDPIEEDGGVNLYGFCGNAVTFRLDYSGLAFFAVRGLGGLKKPVTFDGSLTFLDEWLKRKNLQIAHEQLFFQDGLEPSSVGYGKENLEGEGLDGYIVTSGGYDDCIMRLAVGKVSRGQKPYSMLGIFGEKYNCQDYADALRAKYLEIKNSQEVKCKCKKKRR